MLIIETKDNLLKDLKSKLKRNKGYNLQNELINIRGINEFSICFYSIIFHSIFIFDDILYNQIYLKIKSNINKDNYLNIHIEKLLKIF